MEALVIPISEHPARTPLQVIRTFLNTHQPERVEEVLWDIFTSYAISPRKNMFGLEITDREVAFLFDALIGLTTAMHALKDRFETG